MPWPRPVAPAWDVVALVTDDAPRGCNKVAMTTVPTDKETADEAAGVAADPPVATRSAGVMTLSALSNRLGRRKAVCGGRPLMAVIKNWVKNPREMS